MVVIYLLKFQLCHENPKAQKALLGGFEKMVELHRNALLPKVAHIVKVKTINLLASTKR